MANAHTIAVLGGGVGGQVVGNELRRLLPAEHRAIVIERNRRHAFAPSFLWVMTGERRCEQVTRDLRALMHPSVEVVEAEIRAIDLANRRLQLDRDAIVYDYLVVASGAELSALAVGSRIYGVPVNL